MIRVAVQFLASTKINPGMPIEMYTTNLKMHLMKQVYALIIALITLTTAASARPVIKIAAGNWYGNWSNKNSWDLGRVPQDGDSIVIYGGRAIVVDKVITLNNVYINVTGNNSYIHLKGQLILNSNSFLELGANTRVYGFGASRSNEIITIGGVRKFDQNANINVWGFGIASQYTGVSPNGFSSNAAMALPVKFTSFVAKRDNDNVTLSWSTAEEKNNSHFDIEKSRDGVNWNSIAIVFGNGTTISANSYSYTDKKETSAIVYYRIRQVDMNGQVTYSSVRSIKSAQTASDIAVFASSKNNIAVDMQGGNKSNLNITVVNMNGQVVAKRSYSNVSYRIDVAVTNATAGIYVVQVSDNNGWSETKKVVL
jgi:hypothetical protein